MDRGSGELKQIGLKISGRVQGVGYRWSARDAASRLGLTGWVRNLPDGSVEALAQGDRAVLEEFIDWCRQGPPGARVTNVDATWSEADEKLDGFRIEHGGRLW